MADLITGIPEVDATRSALIAAEVQQELKAQAILLPSVRDVSVYAKPGAKTVSFPKADSFVVQKKQSGEAAQAQALTFSNDTMSLDQHAVIQWLVEDRSELQSEVAVLVESAKRAASAHARQIDLDILSALYLGRSTSNDVDMTGNSNATFALTDINLQRLYIKKSKMRGDVFLAASPEAEKDLLDIENFISAEKYGSNEVLMNGEIGRIFGVRVLVSDMFDDFLAENSITATGSQVAMMYSREALAFAFQQGARFQEQYDLPNLAMRQSLDQLYGLKVLQSGVGVSYSSRSVA